MQRATREWVRKAENDHRLVVRIAAAREQFHDQVCFLCQQSAEKYLKALLSEQGQTIPKTHNLDDLLALLLPHHPSLRSLRRGLISLRTLLWTFGIQARTQQSVRRHQHNVGREKFAACAARFLAFGRVGNGRNAAGYPRNFKAGPSTKTAASVW
jgi:HEPN domain-containing protein